MSKHIEIRTTAYTRSGDEKGESTWLNIVCDEEKCEVQGDQETLNKLRQALDIPGTPVPPDLEEE